jgi:hypothetical protein
LTKSSGWTLYGRHDTTISSSTIGSASYPASVGSGMTLDSSPPGGQTYSVYGTAVYGTTLPDADDTDIDQWRCYASAGTDRCAARRRDGGAGPGRCLHTPGTRYDYQDHRCISVM